MLIFLFLLKRFRRFFTGLYTIIRLVSGLAVNGVNALI